MSTDVPSHPEVEDEPLDSLRRCDIRLRIAMKVGLHTRPDTRFSKRELNMIHAYLTGKHYYPKWQHGAPESPDVGDIRQAVAMEGGVDGYIPTPEELGEGEEAPTRPFRKAELIELCKTVETSSDERPNPMKT